MKKLVEYTPRYNLYIVLEAALSLKICNTLIPLILDYTSGSLLEDWQQLIGNIIDNRGDPEKELIQSLYRVLGQLDQIPARSEEKVLKNFNYLLSGVIAFNEYGNDKNFIESLPILLRRLNIEDKSRELYKKTLFFLDSAEEFTIDKNEMDLLTHFYRQYHIPFSNHTGIQLVRNVFKYICGQLREITSYDPMMLMLPLNIDYLEEKESKYYFIFHGNNLGLKKNLLENLSTFKQDFITYKNYKDFYKREVLPIIKGLEILPEVLGNIVCSYLTVDLKETSSYMLVLLNTLIKQPNVDVRTLYTILL
jgi:hypothetical protein